MTETEWQSLITPYLMRDVARSLSTDRKLRLYYCACCRRVWDLMPDDRCRRAVELAEGYADGLVAAADLAAARLAATEVFVPLLGTAEGIRYCPENWLWWPIGEYPERGDLHTAFRAAFDRTSEFGPPRPPGEVYAAAAAASAACLVASPHLDHMPGADLDTAFAAGFARLGFEEAYSRSDPEEMHAQRELLQDIFGHLFLALPMDPSWLAWDGGVVRRMAESIYAGRRFEDLPYLADALEEAGCANEHVLGHCRSGPVHVPGCWAVDWLLGKE